MTCFGNKKLLVRLVLAVLLLALLGGIALYYGRGDVSALDAGFPEEAPQEYSFLVVGDTHGRGEFFTAVAGKEENALFVIHLGDFTASGTREQYGAFLEQCAALDIPVITVPGNHDVKNHGAGLYQKLCGPANRSFSLNGIQYVFVDTSGLSASEETLRWLEKELNKPGKKYLFTHVPPLDPLGKNHDFINKISAGRFTEILRQHNVAALFAGHVHCYSENELEGVKLIVSGGGGGPLYASSSEGGFHHYLRVRVTGRDMQVEVVPLEISPVSGELAVQGRNNRLFTLDDLLDMRAVEGGSGFENRFGNISGQGEYRGVRVADLVEQAGGMDRDDILAVHSQDGFIQKFSYQNVYPAGDLLDRQGIMLVAYRFNGEMIPEWAEGYRLVFLPADGMYGNEDCSVTSAPGQGWSVYPSAGARWVRNVVKIEVLSCNIN